MSTDTRSAMPLRWLITLLLGAMMSAGIWLAGAHDVAFVGFILAAASEARGGPSCWPRRLRRATS